MSNFVYYNGVFEAFEKATVPITDRAIYFGDGVYEVLLVHNGIPYQFDEHYERLLKSCDALALNPPNDRRAILSIIHRLCDLSCVSDAVVYIQVSRSGGRRKHEIVTKVSNLLITVTPFTLPCPKTLSAITVLDRRHTLCHIKTVNLIYSVLALNEANSHGCDAAIFVRNGSVTEESRSNIFIIRDNTLITHPKDCYILPGIMRENLIALAHKLELRVEERDFNTHELYSADEVLLTSTTKFVARIRCIDERECGMKNDELFSMLYKNLTADFLHKCG